MLCVSADPSKIPFGSDSALVLQAQMANLKRVLVVGQMASQASPGWLVEGPMRPTQRGDDKFDAHTAVPHLDREHGQATFVGLADLDACKALGVVPISIVQQAPLAEGQVAMVTTAPRASIEVGHGGGQVWKEPIEVTSI